MCSRDLLTVKARGVGKSLPFYRKRLEWRFIHLCLCETQRKEPGRFVSDVFCMSLEELEFGR